jgi:hypothetical protein
MASSRSLDQVTEAEAVMTVALWTIYHYSPGYELYDDEAEAAAMAVAMQEDNLGEYGVVMGVQYDDGRALSREDWSAYRAELERRRAEDAARAAAAASQPRKPAPPQRAIRDPFCGYEMDILTSEPAWLGKR